MRARLRTNEADRLSVVGRYRQRVSDDDSFCVCAVQTLRTQFSTAGAYLSFIDKEQERLIAYRGLNLRDLPRDDEFMDPGSEADDVLLIGDVRSTLKETVLAARFAMPELRSLAVAPLISPEGALIGALGILDTVARKFSEQDKTVLVNMAAMVIAGLEGRRDRAAAAPVTHPDVPDLLKSEIYLLHTMMDHSPDNIYFKDRESKFVRVNTSMAKQMGLDDPAKAIGQSDFDLFTKEHAQKAYDDEQAIIRTGVPLVDKEEKETWQDGHVTWVSTSKLPLHDADGKVIGTFGLSRDVTDRKLAQQAVLEHAQALELINARHDAELALASELQRAFLPDGYPCFPPDCEPERSQLQFSHVYLPTEEVGGDFFSVIPLSRNSVGVLVCDVVGHGVRAALVTAMINALVKDLVSYAPDPAVFLHVLNERLWASLGGRFGYGFVTAFYAVVYADEQTVRYAGAGHPSPVLLRREKGVVESLVSGPGMTGLALLLDEHPTYKTHEVALNRGDAVILYTDGLYEVYGRNREAFGMERMVETMEQRIDSGLPELLRHVVAEARAFSKDADFQDDVCLLGVELAAK